MTLEVNERLLSPVFWRREVVDGLAGFLPAARRAARTDPLIALGSE
jgi:hypothetical protein